MRHQVSLAAIVGLGFVGPAMGAISLDLTPVDNSAVLTGYTTYDLEVTTDTDWTAAVGLLGLSAGHLYQHLHGGDKGVPSPRLVMEYPALEFDTYVIGNVAGGAGDIKDSGYAFHEFQLSVSWFNVAMDDFGTSAVGRLTLSDDAAGSLSLLLTSADDRAEYDVTFSPGLSPLLNAIIPETEPEPEPDPWDSPRIFNRPADGWSYDGQSAYSQYIYGENYSSLWTLPTEGSRYGLAPFDMPSEYVSPRLPRARSAFDYDFSSRLMPGYWPKDDPRRLLNPNLVWHLDPAPLDTPDTPSLLPEPAALWLVGLGVGCVSLRRR